nr:GNAT family N-acetyltransferase [uncultured Halomonas sp.]
MTPVFRATNDRTFAETLIRRNMTAYYERLGWHWDSQLFAKQWGEMDSIELCVNTSRVGLLCLYCDDTAYDIRELQIDPPWQRRGLGTAAIHYVEDLARQADVTSLRLRVFRINPARHLYQRLGFRVCQTDSDVITMQRTLR